jgi:hypothetical protein
MPILKRLFADDPVINESAKAGLPAPFKQRLGKGITYRLRMNAMS